MCYTSCHWSIVEYIEQLTQSASKPATYQTYQPTDEPPTHPPTRSPTHSYCCPPITHPDRTHTHPTAPPIAHTPHPTTHPPPRPPVYTVNKSISKPATLPTLHRRAIQWLTHPPDTTVSPHPTSRHTSARLAYQSELTHIHLML